MTSLADFTATSITGRPVDLASLRGNVVLVVNTASRCGFTPQYAGLQELHTRFHEQGLEILGFPCDQFKHQEPGSDEEIAEFCSVNYGVEFPMFSKVEVNGEGVHPLFAWLTGPHEDADPPIPAAPIGWNFTKFLLDGEGRVIARFEPDVEPADLAEPIEQALTARS